MARSAVLLAMVGLGRAAASGPTVLQHDVVFKPGDCDVDGECYPCFRIPALKRLRSGGLVAFAEARGGRSKSCDDHGDVKVVVRVSSDGSGSNSSWGPIFVVANETGHTIGNPSPVVDPDTGRLYCHVSKDNYAALVTHSDDDAKTWSAPRALDSSVKVPGTGWYGSGVGGGVAFPQPGSGQPSTLMILSEERLGPAFNSVPVFSNDHGATWQRGNFLNCTVNNASHGLGEPSVAVLPGTDNHLIMSGRGARAPIVSWSMSTDRGSSWTASTVIATISSPGCQSPILGVQALPSGAGAGAIITSPAGPGRTHLSVYTASLASGFADWALAGVLWQGDGGYSSLLALTASASAGETPLVLFETAGSRQLDLIRFAL